ncbi:MAG: PQQ-dependent sugar dehydrogenase, partial [Gemmatimonadetes bacterium]|nr:PQQ-dependent sugar dehydrogenase [Gemmatimonadota bacterium]
MSVRAGLPTLAVSILCLATAGCMPQPTMPQGVFPREFPTVPSPDPAAAQVPPGYRVEVVLRDLIYPTSVEFDDAGNLYVAEGGYAYGDLVAPPRILRVSPAGELAYVADQRSGLLGPVTDIMWSRGRLYVSHFGKISVLEPNGSLRHLVTDLPASTGHFNNQMSVGPDGMIYFGMGTVTNSGVVDLSEAFPFLTVELYPNLHDVPARDVRLRGESFLTPQPNNVLARQGRLVTLWSNLWYAVASVFDHDRDRSLLVRTGAFQPFGVSSNRVVRGQVKANGTILRMNPDGSGLEVYAWGLRNPFGVRWGPDGRLYASDNAYDERGSRPIANALDNVWVIRQNAWYGWPDFSAGLEPLTDDRFEVPDPQQVPVYVGDELQGLNLGFVIDHEASGLEVADASLVVGRHEVPGTVEGGVAAADALADAGCDLLLVGAAGDRALEGVGDHASSVRRDAQCDNEAGERGTSPRRHTGRTEPPSRRARMAWGGIHMTAITRTMAPVAPEAVRAV